MILQNLGGYSQLSWNFHSRYPIINATYCFTSPLYWSMFNAYMERFPSPSIIATCESDIFERQTHSPTLINNPFNKGLFPLHADGLSEGLRVNAHLPDPARS